MCGRYTLRTLAAELAEFFDLFRDPVWAPRYNIAPTQSVLVVRQALHASHREAVSMRWGLVPSWSKSLTGPPLFNARSETVAEKPSFRAAFKRRRCLIPADGFYEWQVISPKQKQPHYITLRSGSPFAFAGLWETWQPPQGPPVDSCTVLTTSANSFMQPLHNRMPVILSPDEYPLWLDPELTEPDPLLPLLDQYPSGELSAHPVTTLVNSVRNDSSELIVPTE